MNDKSPPQENASVPVKKGPNPIQAFQEEVNLLFRDFFGETLPHWWRVSETYMPFSIRPATDIVEMDKEYKITAELPGMEERDITVTINDDYVTIKGMKKEETKEESAGFSRQERSYGAFQRVVALPHGLADTEKAEASMSKGILTITVPKKADAKTKGRQIEVKHAA